MLTEIAIFFIQGIMEMTGAIAFCIAIARVPINWLHSIVAGTFLAIISFFIQSLSFFFGLHTFIVLFLVTIYISRAGQISIVKSFLLTFVGAFTLGILEFATNYLFLSLTGMPQQEVTSNQVLWTLIGMPQAVLIIILAIAVSRVFKPEKKWLY